MRLRLTGTSEEDYELEEEDWSKKPESHEKLLLVFVALGLALAVAIASFVYIYPYVEENYFGPAPIWHPFSGVFGQSGQLASESCSVRDLQPILGGVGIGKIVATSVVDCSFHGSTYTGYYGKNCNLSPTGPIPSINGTLVPYGGCVLSFAPLNQTIVGIFTLGEAANGSYPVYTNRQVIANMTPTQVWKSFSCTFSSDNSTMSNGPLTCEYLGIPYVTSDVAQTCNLGTPIQVYGVAVNPGSCSLVRSEQVSV